MCISLIKVFSQGFKEMRKFLIFVLAIAWSWISYTDLLSKQYVNQGTQEVYKNNIGNSIWINKTLAPVLSVLFCFWGSGPKMMRISKTGTGNCWMDIDILNYFTKGWILSGLQAQPAGVWWLCPRAGRDNPPTGALSLILTSSASPNPVSRSWPIVPGPGIPMALYSVREVHVQTFRSRS